MTLNGWVDDIGFDGSHKDADILPARTIKAWHELRDQLQAAGLRVNSNKTAFLSQTKPPTWPSPSYWNQMILPYKQS